MSFISFHWIPFQASSVDLSVVGCSGVMLGFTNTAEYGLGSLLVIVPIIIGVIALLFFVRRQRGLEKPLINLEVLKNKYFTVGLIFICILYFCLNGYTALVPFPCSRRVCRFWLLCISIHRLLLSNRM